MAEFPFLQELAKTDRIQLNHCVFCGLWTGDAMHLISILDHEANRMLLKTACTKCLKERFLL